MRTRNWFITGGTPGGFGMAYAEAALDLGDRVVLTARRPAELETWARAYGDRVLVLPLDVTDAGQVQNAVHAAEQHYGGIDVVVNNAGVDCESPVVNLDVDLLDRCLAVNVRGPLLLCKFALPTLIAQRSGSILCITSGAARAYRSGRVGYSMSKAALERMFLCLAEEVRPNNIAVNVLSPGRVDAWMNRNGDWPGTSHIPMEQPDTIIPAAVWLATQTATSFTGQVVERAEFGVTWGPGIPVAS